MKIQSKTFRMAIGFMGLGLTLAAQGAQLQTPMANELEQNRDSVAAQTLRLSTSAVSGRYELPTAKNKSSDGGGTSKDSGQNIHLFGVYSDERGYKFAIRGVQADLRRKSDGATAKAHKTEIGAMVAHAYTDQLGFGLEVASVQAKVSFDGTNNSESYLKFLPSAIYVNRDFEAIISWHPTIAINHKSIYEPGYLRVRGSKPFAPDMTAVGILTHYRYSKLDNDFLDDAFELFGGVRHTAAPDLIVSGFLAYAQDGTSDVGHVVYPQYVGNMGFDLEAEHTLPNDNQIVGGALRWRNGKGSGGGFSTKRSVLDFLVSYGQRF